MTLDEIKADRTAQWNSFGNGEDLCKCRACEDGLGYALSDRAFTRSRAHRGVRQTPAGALCLWHWLYYTMVCPRCNSERCMTTDSFCMSCEDDLGRLLAEHAPGPDRMLDMHAQQISEADRYGEGVRMRRERGKEKTGRHIASTAFSNRKKRGTAGAKSESGHAGQ